MIIAFHIVLLLLLLLCSGFFSSAEVAFFSLSPLQMRRMDDRQPGVAARVRTAVEQPARLLSSILIGNTLVNVCASGVAYSLVRHLGYRHAAEMTIPAITMLLLVFGEIGPKRLALHNNLGLSSLYAAPMLLIMRLLTPLRLMLEKATSFTQRRFVTVEKMMTGQEFETLVEMGRESGALNEEEVDMVKTIIRLNDLQVSDIMTPRQDVIGIDLDDPKPDIAAFIREKRVPRLVVFRENLDQVAGVLDARDYLLEPGFSLERDLREPFYVPECMRLDVLLEEFQQGGYRLAVVVDEYGGTAGVVTRGDILEEIVGDMDDRQAGHKLDIEPMGPGHWLVDAAISLEELNEELDLKLKADGVDRLAGWFVAHLERLPRPGEAVVAQGCRAIVRQMRRHRIILIELSRLDPGEDA